MSSNDNKTCPKSNYFPQVRKLAIILILLFVVNMIIREYLSRQNKLMLSLLFIAIFCFIAPVLDFISPGLVDALSIGIMFAIGMSFLNLSDYSSPDHIVNAASEGIKNLANR